MQITTIGLLFLLVLWYIYDPYPRSDWFGFNLMDDGSGSRFGYMSLLAFIALAICLYLARNELYRSPSIQYIRNVRRGAACRTAARLHTLLQ